MDGAETDEFRRSGAQGATGMSERAARHHGQHETGHGADGERVGCHRRHQTGLHAQPGSQQKIRSGIQA